MTFTDVYAETYEQIYAYAFRHTGSREGAEGLTQAIFASARKGYQRFRHQGRPLLTWLYGIAWRRTADHLAAHGEEREGLGQLHAAMRNMGQVDRTVIDLTLFSGLLPQEVAQILGITETAAATRLERALERLGRGPGVGALERLVAVIPDAEPPRPELRAELLERLMGREQVPTTGPISYTVVSLPPLGDVYVGYTEQGICLLSGAVANQAEFEAQVLERYRCGAERDDARQGRWQKALERWLQDGKPGAPIDLSRVTPFERSVLDATMQIGRGSVRPYQWLAREVGKPGASRAIGNVMARNPIPLFIPCHRVVAASGVIGNYSMGGPLVKRLLLELEGVEVERLQRLAAEGWRYKADKTTGSYCFPTCREILPKHELHFRSTAEAEKAGYQPCKVCRPN